jgi:hypothetical protein
LSILGNLFSENLSIKVGREVGVIVGFEVGHVGLVVG